MANGEPPISLSSAPSWSAGTDGADCDQSQATERSCERLPWWANDGADVECVEAVKLP